MKRYLLQLFAFIVLFSAIEVHGQVSNVEENDTLTSRGFPAAHGYVSDFEGLFTENQVKELEEIIAGFVKTTGNQIAVASIESIGSYTDFNEYALDLSRYWGVGTAENDNGMTMIFSEGLRKIRISTGSGTSPYLTDDECKEVIDTYIIPEFKNGHYFEGIKTGLQQLIARWE